MLFFVAGHFAWWQVQGFYALLLLLAVLPAWVISSKYFHTTIFRMVTMQTQNFFVLPPKCLAWLISQICFAEAFSHFQICWAILLYPWVLLIIFLLPSWSYALAIFQLPYCIWWIGNLFKLMIASLMHIIRSPVFRLCLAVSFFLLKI